MMKMVNFLHGTRVRGNAGPPVASPGLPDQQLKTVKTNVKRTGAE